MNHQSVMTEHDAKAFVRQMIAEIIEREDGYVDHEDDRGGATKHGVSLRYARGIGLDMDGDGDVDKDDIMLVTPNKAAELYEEDFYLSPRINRLPPELQPLLFDSAVHHGPARPLQFLQAAINRYDLWRPLIVDGVYGKNTRRAMEKVIERVGVIDLQNMVVTERIAFMRSIVERDPTQQSFIDGWLNRARSFYRDEEAA